MSKKRSGQDQLRTEAETQLVRNPEKGGALRPAEEILHELEVYQVELEMQNESLFQYEMSLKDWRISNMK